MKTFIATILLLLATVLSSTNAEVVELNDATFEHQTQASTGMTTGSWLILFKATRCPHCAKLQPLYEELSQDEELLERGIVLGTVNIMESPTTANRFMIRGFPTLIYLHQKKLYRYTGKRDLESMKQFVLGGFESVGGEDIPSPPSKTEYYIKMVKAIGLELRDAAMGKAGPVGYAILVLVGMLMAIFIAIISMFFLPAKKVKTN
mmetsp:Transcript_6435/g.9424  ORF Transcript_6435/g.9424 Transcript_6435/m.9424 type:complete len:205 (+) Transcript_6435:147-761(+)|eukprot:CAMPEP_0197239156 /NCGR_PEP_ID=MMETSP1429-20130617/5667_1 /TAXON_ID=49237 /ORGANISM="Chaetoceros  sp., Strain UNC1202" /LENGTH=204 /DNA_ID=CAMNT_0042698517 /DNA_START=120 /DNA_END=734 /DNA_ORIENTATION=+